MKVIIKCAFVCVLFIVAGCGSTGSSGPEYDLKGFTTESIGGGGLAAEYRDQNNVLLSKGHVINGVRNGIWITYHQNSTKIKTVSNYINGRKNGLELTFNDRGQIEKHTEYRNDQLHGLSASYRNARTLNETNYKEGKMDGPFAVYDESNGKIQRSGSFKNGLQHGELVFYDGNGNVTLKYEYKNGEKVSGGIVE